MWMAWFMGCASPEAVPAPAPPEPVTAAPAAVDAPVPEGATAEAQDSRAYVAASELRVRAAPTMTGRVLGKLPINSPVKLGAEEDGFVAVTLGSGTEGFVASAYLRPAPLSLEEALAQAASTSELSWWQRATAIDPSSRAALEGLEAAYRRAGQAREADRVKEQLAWPHEVLLVARSHRVDTLERADVAVVQWATTGDHGKAHTVGEAERARLGVPDTFTVLPDVGPPVQATVREVWAGVHNECSGVHVVEVVLDVPLPPERRPLAASRGAVPRSWRDDGRVPARSRAEAEAVVAAGPPPAEGMVRTGVAVVDGRWRGRRLVGSGEPGDAWEVVEGWVDGDRFAGEPAPGSFDGFLEIGRRDVDGDGEVERVLGDGCMTLAVPVGAAGSEPHWEAITDPWCCGC